MVSSSPPSTPAQERDTQLLSVGKQCSHSSCLRFDFLPFKCQHCEHFFCLEHFGVEAHSCDHYDESKFNRVAPNCPLCSIPVAFRQGEDPNIPMDMHIENDCSVVTGKMGPKSKRPTCARATCKKTLILPPCDKCSHQFCPSHRFPDDHTCSPQAQAAQANTRTTSNLRSRLENLSDNLSAKAQAAPKVNAQAAAKWITTKTNTLGPKIATAASASTSSASNAAKTMMQSKSLPFNKMDRRARAERESRLKAMRARGAKGLLSEGEKAFLAAEEVAAQEKDDSGCITM